MLNANANGLLDISTRQPDPDGPWLVQMTWRIDIPDPLLIRFTVEPAERDDSTELLASTIRELPLGAIFRHGRDRALKMREMAAQHDDHVDAASSVDHRRPRSTRRKWVSSDYKDVAVVYVRAHEAGLAPRQHVASWFGVSGDYASKLIRQARDMGFIVGDTRVGTAGGSLHPDLEEWSVRGARAQAVADATTS